MKIGNQGSLQDSYDRRFSENSVYTQELEGLPNDLKEQIKDHVWEQYGRALHLTTENDPHGVNDLEDDSEILKIFESSEHRNDQRQAKRQNRAQRHDNRMRDERSINDDELNDNNEELRSRSGIRRPAHS